MGGVDQFGNDHGGDWSRQRLSSEVKRVEESDNDLVNHGSQKKSSANSKRADFALAA
jgi:hypothetical protein